MSRLLHPEVYGSPAGYFFRKSLFCLYRNHLRAVGCPLLYSCRTLRGRPHKKPPMGSRSASFNADCREPAAVAKEKRVLHSFMMFQIRFSLLGGCFACNCSAAVFSRSCRIGSGIHFRAVGLLTPKSRAHLDTLPPGFALYQASTLACCVGSP